MIAVDIRAVTAAFNSMRDSLSAPAITVQNFEKQHDITLPFNTLKEFQEFDLKLSRDEVFNGTFVRIFNLKQKKTFLLY